MEEVVENSPSPPKKSFSKRGPVLAVIVAIVFVAAGFFYWQKNSVEPAPQPQPQPSIKTHEVISIDNGWNEYRDYENHYAFRFPKEVSSIRGCPFDEKQKVQLIVLRAGNTSYLKESQVAQWNQDRTCETVQLSLANMPSRTFAFMAADARNDEEINAFLQKEYDPGCLIAEKAPDPKDTSKIHIRMEQSEPDAPEEELCFINYVTNVVWSEKFGKIVKWDIGQDFNFIDDTKKEADGFGHIYDGEISDSFRFE